MLICKFGFYNLCYKCLKIIEHIITYIFYYVHLDGTEVFNKCIESIFELYLTTENMTIVPIMLFIFRTNIVIYYYKHYKHKITKNEIQLNLIIANTGVIIICNKIMKYRLNH